MKNLYYSQLSQTAQIEAFRQVMALNPIETRTRNMSDLLENYEYNRFGEVMQGEPEYREKVSFGGQGGDEPEWREY